jgi:hypothetical protein
MNQMMGMNPNPNIGWNQGMGQMNIPGYDAQNFPNMKK